MDELARYRGIDRSAVYRIAAREFLASLHYLDEDMKKALGVASLNGQK
jgi:hypothetical protein